MKQFSKTIILGSLLFFSFSLFGQRKESEKGWLTGNSITYCSPVGNMEAYNYGLGFYANADYVFNNYFAARLDIGWNDFTGPEHRYIDVNGNYHDTKPSLSVWEFTAGARANISIFYLEGRGGYFSGVHGWGIVPAIGLRYKKIDFQANFNIVGDYHWGGIRLAYYWNID